MNGKRRRGLGCVFLVCAALAAGLPDEGAAQSRPEGEMRWALYVTLSPVWFDPAEVVGVITPFWVIYALHDALVKPMPGSLMAGSLAESWTVSPDQRVYEFKLREGLKFHNGDPFTAEDVKFSFARARAKILHDKVREVAVVGPHRVRFQLHEPWPDFMTFYGTFASGAGWVVPKKYVEHVGNDGFKKHPVGLGPYKFVSHTPGVELVMEAFEGYWRKVPHVKRLVYKSVPEATTRLAMLKRGEVDLAYLLDAPQAEEVRRNPSLKLAFSGGIGTFYLDFFDQWDPQSPWHDRRVRLAAVHAIDSRALNDAENLGASRLTGSMVPRKFDFALALEPYAYDPAKAKRLLAEAGYPDGFDAGDLHPWPPYFSMGEAIGGYLHNVGIQTRLRTMERAAMTTAWREKKLKNVIVGITGAAGNAATRLEAYVSKNGVYTSGVMPDVEDLFQRQARETDVRKREALIHQIQGILHERVTHIPIYELAFIWGIGPRAEEPGINLIRGYAYSAPYEDLKIKR